MTTAAIDIETYRDEDLIADALGAMPEFRPPANYRNPDTIAGYIASARQDWIEATIEKAALSPLTGKVVAWTLCSDGGSRTVTGLEPDGEGALLRRLIDAVVQDRVTQLVGFNSESFDVPFLRWRMMRHGFKAQSILRSQKPWETHPRLDLRLLLQDGDKRAPGTLDRVCSFLRVEVPPFVEHPMGGAPVSGKDVGGLVDLGEGDVLRDYCERDGQVTWALYQRLRELGVAP